jgi:hypothetical protein
MTHAIHRVERFEIVGPYTLALGFEDGTEQRIDFRPVLEGELFGPLQNPNVFNAVSLDKEVGTLRHFVVPRQHTQSGCCWLRRVLSRMINT